MKPVITKTVWTLSLVSLFTDMASEMLYPVMPVYLKSIGFSVLAIGILEGVAECIAGLSKGYFGKQSDVLGKRIPFVRTGYALSALSKPMLALSQHTAWIFTARSIDRLGKGIRTGARDAVLSAESEPQHKAAIFGFHRGMDTAGAFIGPLFALLYLYYYPDNYNPLFLIAALPGCIAIGLTWLLKEPAHTVPAAAQKISFSAFYRYFKDAPAAYRKLVYGLLVFAVFNSSDVFLLLMLKEAGFSNTYLLAAYIFYNMVYAFAAYPLGRLADKTGPRIMLGAGLILFSVTYAGFAFNTGFAGFLVLFLCYGLYAAATEGISKAWICLLVDKKDTGAATGTYSGFQSIAAFLASTIAGAIWLHWGAPAVFLISAAATAGVAVYIFGFLSPPPVQQKH